MPSARFGVSFAAGASADTSSGDNGPWSLYIADFCCVESHLIVEADGEQHNPEEDRTRTRFLESAGYRILRYWNNDVLTNMDGVLGAILEALVA